MDALILSCGTGGGHHAAAAAVAEALQARGHRVTLLNPYELTEGAAAHRIDKAYCSLVQSAPYLFGLIYQLGNAWRRLPGVSPVYLLNRMMAPRLAAYLQEHAYDAVIMTHLFPAQILTVLKKQGVPVPPLWFIATDYACIPFTEETDCDRYVVPAAALAEDFASRGIPADRLLPLGIPVAEAYSCPADRDALCRSLGLRPEQRQILLAGGSVGAGPLLHAAELLLAHFGTEETHLTIICGQNKRLYDKMAARFGESCTVLRHTDRMADYMRVCDLFLSKPGGLSSTEAAVCGAALVHIAPIPGCETLNLRFFSQNGLSCPVRDLRRELVPACETLLSPADRDAQRQAQRRTIPPDAAGAICRRLEQALGETI